MSEIRNQLAGTPLSPWKTRLLIGKESAAPGTYEAVFTLDFDTVLLSLAVPSIAGGATLDCALYTETEADQVEICTFPQVTAATTELQLRRASSAMGVCRLVVVVAGGAASFEVRAKAVTGTTEPLTVVTEPGTSLSTDDTPRTQGLYTELTVGTTPVELKVGASVQTGRKYASIRPKDSAVWWGYDSSVSSVTGTKCFRDELVFIPAGFSIFLVAALAGQKVSIGELS